MRLLWLRMGLLLGLSLLTACATLKPDYDPPQVALTSLRLVDNSAQQSLAPSFDIGLQVTNPNSDPLRIQGIAYTLSVEGQEVLNGASSDLPEIPAYGQKDLQLRAKANLLSGLKLLGRLVGTRGERRLRYELKTKVDLGGIMPAIRNSKTGELSLEDLLATET